MYCQQLLYELEADYVGHPYYVSGNAILHALAPELDIETQQSLSFSHGMFVPGAFGVFPDEASQSGSHPAYGSTLHDVERYADLFIHRSPENHWLLDSRPRDAINTLPLRVQSDQPGVAPEKVFGLPESAYQTKRTVSVYIQCQILGDAETLPLSEDTLDPLQFGGRRNYGYGEASLADSQLVDLETLDYSRIADADAWVLELVTPYVTDSEHPNSHHHDIPWWWELEPEQELRRREEAIVEQREMYDLETIDHGQVVGYGGTEPVKTAQSGFSGIGTHSKYGFGEVRIKPVGN